MINNKIPLEILKRNNKFTLEELGAVFVMMNQSELDLKDLAHWINSFEYADTINDLVYEGRIIIRQGSLHINSEIPIGETNDELEKALKDDHAPSEPVKKRMVMVIVEETDECHIDWDSYMEELL